MKVYITAPLSHRFDTSTREQFVNRVNSIDGILKELKFSTYLTYRDFLRWGKVTFKPDTVFEKFTYELKNSDLILAIHPNEGIGSNIVLGMAAALKKPIIILVDRSFNLDSLPGLIYRGFYKITKCEILVYDDVADLRKKLRKSLKLLMLKK